MAIPTVRRRGVGDFTDGKVRDRAFLPIDFYQQEYEMWCWAACIQMVQTMGGTTKRQCQIVSDTMGLDCCANADEMHYACRNADIVPDVMDMAFNSNHLSHTRLADFQSLNPPVVKTAIDKGHAIFVIWEAIAAGQVVSVSHAGLIGGYDTEADYELETLVYDPATKHQFPLWRTIRKVNSYYGWGRVSHAREVWPTKP